MTPPPPPPPPPLGQIESTVASQTNIPIPSPVSISTASTVATRNPPPSLTTTTTTTSITTNTSSPSTTKASSPIALTTTPSTLALASSSSTPQVQPQIMSIASTQSQPCQPIALTTTPTTSGPTALVIIPQTANNTTSGARMSTVSISKTAPTTVSPATHFALATTTSTPIQLQAPLTTHLSNVSPLPVTSHQQTAQPTATKAPTTLSVVTIAPGAQTPAKTTINKCCLLDNGLRCDRVAGNASFNARIQKVVATKKMNFTLDPTVRHAYLCDDHKAIILAAKKNTPSNKEPKSNARNHVTANLNTLNAQSNNAYIDLSMGQVRGRRANPPILVSSHPNHHNNALNNTAIGSGAQIAYAHYSGTHLNQFAPMDVVMAGNYDNMAGDTLPSGSGGVDVDLQQLQVNTLRRYKRHFRVPTRPGLNKSQLAECLKGHFRTLPIIEKEAITYFVYIVKCSRNKLDQNPRAD